MSLEMLFSGPPLMGPRYCKPNEGQHGQPKYQFQYYQREGFVHDVPWEVKLKPRGHQQPAYEAKLNSSFPPGFSCKCFSNKMVGQPIKHSDQ